jgi:phosphate transport system substrate-binding protein
MKRHFTARTPRRVLALVLAASLVVAACGDSDDDTSSDDGATTTEASAETTESGTDTTAAGSDTTAGGSGEELSGDISITGSSTVEPITNLAAEAFIQQHPGVAFSVSGPGSGDGHAAACAGEVPIWNSSRQIADDEVQCLTDAGIEFIELRIAIDGISVITSVNNSEVECLSFGDLYSLIGIESTGFSDWSDANDLAAEIEGTNPPYPELPLTIFAPGEESGTFDSFSELALEDIHEARVESAGADDSSAVRPDYTASPNDNVIIEGISGNDSSLGWVGFAFADENSDRVKLLGVDGGSGCVEPTPETIASGDFPLARYLYMYVDAAQADDPVVGGFVDYMLSDEGLTHVTEADYVMLDDADLQQSRDNWTSRSTGVTFTS